MKLKIYILSLLFTVFCVAGCASINSGLANKSQQSEPTRTQELLKAGAEYLQKDEIDKAQAVFNTGLKFDLNSAALHFFNAFTYQLKYEKGDRDSFSSA
jgi:Tfp pilus assembly protein PilF